MEKIFVYLSVNKSFKKCMRIIPVLNFYIIFRFSNALDLTRPSKRKSKWNWKLENQIIDGMELRATFVKIEHLKAAKRLVTAIPTAAPCAITEIPSVIIFKLVIFRQVHPMMVPSMQVRLIAYLVNQLINYRFIFFWTRKLLETTLLKYNLITKRRF